MLFTSNKTAEALHKMDDDQLHKELSSAVTLARKSLSESKEKRKELKLQRMAALERKKKTETRYKNATELKQH